jgi:hypothetical protein
LNDIDKQLRDALSRCSPPAGFTDRVLARAAAQGKRPAWRPWLFRLGWPTLRWVTVPTLAAMLVTGVGYHFYELRKQEVEARVARDQVLLALRITGSKLKLAKEKVKKVEMGEPSSEKKL